MKVIIFSLLSLFACSSSVKTPSTLVGEYEISVRLKEKSKEVLNSMKDSVKLALQEAKKQMADTKISLDLNDIDTSTAEGKIEYAAKSLTKQFTDSLSPEFGMLADGVSALAHSTGDIGIKMLETVLKLVTIQVSLKEDGSISTNQELIKAQFNTDLKWKQDGDKFILLNSDGATEQSFIIQNRRDSGFDLVNEEISLHFQKIK